MEYNAVKGHGVTISIQRFPDRKSKYICIEHDGENAIYPVAPIRVESNAEFLSLNLPNYAERRWSTDELLPAIEPPMPAWLRLVPQDHQCRRLRDMPLRRAGGSQRSAQDCSRYLQA